MENRIVSAELNAARRALIVEFQDRIESDDEQGSDPARAQTLSEVVEFLEDKVAYLERFEKAEAKRRQAEARRAQARATEAALLERRVELVLAALASAGRDVYSFDAFQVQAQLYFVEKHIPFDGGPCLGFQAGKGTAFSTHIGRVCDEIERLKFGHQRKGPDGRLQTFGLTDEGRRRGEKSLAALPREIVIQMASLAATALSLDTWEQCKAYFREKHPEMVLPPSGGGAAQ